MVRWIGPRLPGPVQGREAAQAAAEGDQVVDLVRPEAELHLAVLDDGGVTQLAVELGAAHLGHGSGQVAQGLALAFDGVADFVVKALS